MGSAEATWQQVSSRLWSWKTITAAEAAEGWVEVETVVPRRWDWLNNPTRYADAATETLQKEYGEVLRVHRVTLTRSQMARSGRRVYAYSGVVRGEPSVRDEDRQH